MGNGMLAVLLRYRIKLPVVGIPSDRRIHSAQFMLHHTVNDSDIFTRHTMILQLLG
ncbi:hypothetical protein D3C71_2166650 [compost metagenome]